MRKKNQIRKQIPVGVFNRPASEVAKEIENGKYDFLHKDIKTEEDFDLHGASMD